MPTATLHQPATTPQRIDWMGLRLDLPRPWEIVRHSTATRKGSLVFADRTRQRLQLTWTACARRPDVARLLADHRARQRAPGSTPGTTPGTTPESSSAIKFTTPLLPAGWRGTQRTDEAGSTLTRAARFDDKSSRLIEVVLDTDARDPDDDGLIHDLLGGVVVTGRAEEARRFRAFGLDVTAPDGFQLVGAAIQPADAALMFSTHPGARDPDKHPSLTVRRRAMADVWFDGDLERLLQQYAPRAAMEFTPQASRLTPHASTSATWNVPGPRAHRLLNLHRVATAFAWRCAADNAVYQVTATAPAKLRPRLDALRVACGRGGCHG